MANNGSVINDEPDNGLTASEIDVAKTEGQIKDSSLNKVLRLIEEHPARTLEVIREWLH
jgi:flagellar biosynthesis/type III secretory pathway M-ring protein FliF/YscJ